LRETRGEISAGDAALGFPRAGTAPNRLVADATARTRRFDWQTPRFDDGQRAADDTLLPKVPLAADCR